MFDNAELPPILDLKNKRKDFSASPLSQYQIDKKPIILEDPDSRILEVDEERKRRLSTGITRSMKIDPKTGEVLAPKRIEIMSNVFEKPFVLNPPEEIVESECNLKKSQGGFVIVDIGHGYGISTDLNKDDVFIGIEPNLGVGEHKIKTLKTGRCNVDRETSTFVFESGVQDVKLKIKPDLVMCIAPHPADIMRGSIFVGVKELLLDNSNASFLLVFEGDSVEAHEDKGQMLESIKRSFGKEYEVITIKKDTTVESIPMNIMEKHFGVARRVVFNSNSFQGEAKKTIYKVRKRKD